MFGLWECCGYCSDGVYEEFVEAPEPVSLPAPLPQWPKGNDFAAGKISLGEIEVVKITRFETIWSCSQLLLKEKGVTFYKPIGVPDGYFSVGHYCQPMDKKLSGYVLVVKSVSANDSPPLEKPLSYTLVWSSNSGGNVCGYVWLPNPPEGYKPMGFVVTTEPNEPDLDEVRCVRADLTVSCEVGEQIFDRKSIFSKGRFCVWNTRPCTRGMLSDGVPVGTFFCCRDESSADEDLNIACLKNLDSSLCAMPNLEQVHALIKHYGPTVYFHPEEAYLPSSVSWFFKNGALLYKDGKDKGLTIDSRGFILPGGGSNDKQFWIDLPGDDDVVSDYIKSGDIDTAELYVHVKPASGGTFTNIAMWIFCPFNGPASIKVGSLFNYNFERVGQHVGDWEHYTLRVSNFDGELLSIYFSEHSGGEWLDASELEFIEGNKSIVYASKNGHASYPHEGCFLQGSTKLGIGAKNECAKSKYAIDSSTRYRIVAAEYLGDVVPEPHWLQYMREWGPTVIYDSRSEVEKILERLPLFVRFSFEDLMELFPTELYGEEGPTGPKEKDNWFGEERC